MEAVKNDELLAKLENLSLRLHKESKVYGTLTIILSILDVLTGLICIVFTSIQITAFITSILSGSVVCSRAIQVLKSRNLIKTIALINGVSASYIVSRAKKGEYMKNFFKANKFSLILSTGIGGIVGCSAFFLMPLVWATAPLWASILIACGIGIIIWLMIFFLGKEKTFEYLLRVGTKYLPEDKISQVIDMANKFTEEVKNAEEEELKKKQLIVEKEKAKKIIEEYENAKKILEENKAE